MHRKLMVALIVVMLLASGLVASVAHAQPSQSTVVLVTEDDIVRQEEDTTPTNNWVLFTRTEASLGEIASGPGTPPIGENSLHLTTPASGDKVFLFNFDYVGTPLSDIDAISYATYQASAISAVQVPALNFVVDYNGPADGGFTTLVFEPVYNTSQGSIVSGAWQSWEAYASGNAIWWSSKEIPGVCAFDCFVTWNSILTANPDAVILGGFGVNQGSGNAGLVAATDALTIGVNGATTTYNFDVAPPTSNDLLDQLQEDTAEQVSNPLLSRFLQMPLNLAEFAMDRGQPQVANLMLMKYTFMVRLYSFLHLIPMDTANSLIEQAQEIIQLNMQQPPQQSL